MTLAGLLLYGLRPLNQRARAPGKAYMSSALLEDLRDRGLIFQIAGEDDLAGWLDGGSLNEVGSSPWSIMY